MSQSVAGDDPSELPRVFISYAREDSSFVEHLQAFLESEGVPVWRDTTLLPLATAVRRGVANAIEACVALVVVMTGHARASEFVATEIAYAQQQRKPMFGLLLEGQPLFALSDSNYVDVSGGQLPPPALVEQLRGLVDRAVEMLPADRALRLQGARLVDDGIKLQEQGSYEQARTGYLEALDLFQRAGWAEGVRSAINQLGIIEHATGRLPSARALFEQAVELSRTANDLEGLATAYANLANICLESKELAAAEDYTHRSLAISRQTDDRAAIGNRLFDLGHLALERKDHEDARRFYLGARQEFVEADDRLGQAQVEHQLGKVALVAGDLETARDRFRNALMMKVVLTDREGLGNSYIYLGAVEVELGDLTHGIEHLFQSLAVRHQISSPQVIESVRTLGAIEAVHGTMATRRIGREGGLGFAVDLYESLIEDEGHSGR